MHTGLALKTLSYQERLVALDLESLELRRTKFDLCMYYKIINGLVKINKDDFFNFVINPHFTRGHGFKLVMPVIKNNTLCNMFACRCIKIWNELPSCVVDAPSLFVFKKQINKLSEFLYKFLHGRAFETI